MPLFELGTAFGVRAASSADLSHAPFFHRNSRTRASGAQHGWWGSVFVYPSIFVVQVAEVGLHVKSFTCDFPYEVGWIVEVSVSVDVGN